jgi:hypothetical protein
MRGGLKEVETHWSHTHWNYQTGQGMAWKLSSEFWGLWESLFYCILKATLALDNQECVCGTGASGEFKKQPWFLSFWLGQDVGWYAMMQQGLIFQKGQRQNKITSVPGEEMGGRGSGSHDKTQKARLLWGCIITAKMAGRCSPPYTGRHTHTHTKPPRRGQWHLLLLPHPLPCPIAQEMVSWKTDQCPHVCRLGTFLHGERISVWGIFKNLFVGCLP